MKMKLVAVALLSIAMAPVAQAGVIATFKTYDESPYGYGLNGQSTMSLWDERGPCNGNRYTITDKSGAVTSEGCWSSRQEGYGYTVILEGLGSIPGYLFEGTEYARQLAESARP